MRNLQEALAEFPSDPELIQLEKLTRNRQELAAHALVSLNQGKALCAEGRFDEGIALLRKAVEQNPKDVEARGVLIEWLLKRGYAELERDLEAAEALAQQVLDIDKGHAQAKNLLSLSHDRQVEHFVSGIVTQARELQTEGRVGDALKLLQQALTRYPTEMRLRRLRETLAKEWDPAHSRDLEHALKLESEADHTTDPDSRKALLEQARQLRSQNPATENAAPANALEVPERRAAQRIHAQRLESIVSPIRQPATLSQKLASLFAALRSLLVAAFSATKIGFQRLRARTTAAGNASSSRWTDQGTRWLRQGWQWLLQDKRPRWALLFGAAAVILLLVTVSDRDESRGRTAPRPPAAVGPVALEIRTVPSAP